MEKELILEQVFNFISEVIKITILQVAILLGPLLILSLLLHFVSHWFRNSLYWLIGDRLYFILFEKLSIILHEFGHAMFCFIFRHRVYHIDLSRENAHVGRKYSPDNAYQLVGEFFVGLGPILLATSILYLSAYLMFRETILVPFINLEISYLDFESFKSIRGFLSVSMTTFFSVLKDFFALKNWIDWKFYLFLYVLIVAGNSMSLSLDDIRIFFLGFSVVIVFFLISSIIFQFTGSLDESWLFSITRYYSSFISVMLLCLLFNATLIIPLSILTMLKKILFRSFNSQYP
jgi:hypothetical protein